jgi:hypothetical protein
MLGVGRSKHLIFFSTKIRGRNFLFCDKSFVLAEKSFEEKIAPMIKELTRINLSSLCLSWVQVGEIFTIVKELHNSFAWNIFGNFCHL